MPRPRKQRTFAKIIHSAVYKPAGVPLEALRQVTLLSDELEALRLADLQGLTQVEAARLMSVSRSTFQRILENAHRQVALALVQGQALQIVGSSFELTAPSRRVRYRREPDS